MSEPTINSPGVRLYAAARGMDKVRALVSVICHKEPEKSAMRLAAEAECLCREARLNALRDVLDICDHAPTTDAIKTLIDEVQK